MSQRNETIRIILGYLFAFFVVGAALWFLYEAFLNPDTGTLPDTVSGIIVGGLLSIITAAATFVFGIAVMNSASRSAATATQAGVNAALTTPPQPTITADSGPPPSVTITPAETPPPEPTPDG